MLVLLPTLSSKLLAKWQGPFEITQQVNILDYEVVLTDWGGTHQIYHLNLLKKWGEAESMLLATSMEKMMLGRRHAQNANLSLWPWVEIISRPSSSLSSQVADRICRCVLTPTWSHKSFSAS